MFKSFTVCTKAPSQFTFEHYVKVGYDPMLYSFSSSMQCWPCNYEIQYFLFFLFSDGTKNKFKCCVRGWLTGWTDPCILTNAPALAWLWRYPSWRIIFILISSVFQVLFQFFKNALEKSSCLHEILHSTTFQFDYERVYNEYQSLAKRGIFLYLNQSSMMQCKFLGKFWLKKFFGFGVWLKKF